MVAKRANYPHSQYGASHHWPLQLTGLYNSGEIYLSKIVSEWPIPGKDPSLFNRLWRFLDNKRVNVQKWYQPLAEQIVARFTKMKRMFLLVDTTKVGFNHRVLAVGAAFKKRALPLGWTVERGPKGHTTHKTRRYGCWVTANFNQSPC
jgi:hypothetical protein